MLGLSSSLDKGSVTFKDVHSIALDGTNDCLVTESDTTLADATYSFWAKSSETGLNSQYVFGHGVDSHACGSLQFNKDSSGAKILYHLGTNFWTYWPDNSAQDDGAWHHWALWVDASDPTANKLYLDGSLLSQHNSNNTGSATAYTEGLIIGGSKADSGSYYGGNISDFAWFNTELDADAITAIYNNGHPFDLTINHGNYDNASNLQGYWKMGDGGLDTYPLIADQTNATLGANPAVFSSLDLTNTTNWGDSPGSGSISKTTNTFTSTATGGVHGKNAGAAALTANKVYKCILDATTTASSGFKVRSAGGSAVYLTHGSTDNYSNTFYFRTDHVELLFQNQGAGTMTINSVHISLVNGNPGFMTNMAAADIEVDSP
jgi:hypothetical protein